MSVFGPFASQALVVVPVRLLEELFGIDPSTAKRSVVIDGVERDLDRLRKRDADLATGGIAGSASTMALELENPYNSATSKSMCARALREAMDRLRELAPPEEKRDGIDDLAARRAHRRAGVAVPPAKPRS